MPDAGSSVPETIIVHVGGDGWPRGVLDPLCPREHVITTSTDRRLLWHLVTELAVSATTDALRSLGRRLSAYLHETCEHHWHDYEADGDMEAFRQCLWCNDVEGPEQRDGHPEDRCASVQCCRCYPPRSPR